MKTYTLKLTEEEVIHIAGMIEAYMEFDSTEEIEQRILEKCRAERKKAWIDNGAIKS